MTEIPIIPDAPPRIRERLKNITCLKSKKARFEITVVGHPKPKVTWSYNDAGRPETVRTEQIGDKYILELDHITSEQTGEIKVTARNDIDTDSSNANLRVVDKVRAAVCNLDNEDTTELESILETFSDVELYPLVLFGGDIIEYLKHSLQENDFGIFKVPKTLVHVQGVVSQALQWQQNNKYRKLIPIYAKPNECDPSHPEFLRNCPLFMRDDEGTDNGDFADELHKALTDGQVIEELYPLGDVSTGLAINYFTPISVLLSKEFEQKYIAKCGQLQNQEPDVQFETVEKTIIAFPEHCTCEQALSEYGKEFENPITIELTQSEMHGLRRNFTIHMYRLKYENKVYLPRIEIPNIITTLHKMSENSSDIITNVRKLTNEQMGVQRDAFVKEIDALLQFHNSDRYTIMYFDEKRRLLADTVLEVIQQEHTQSQQSQIREIRKNNPVASIVWDQDNQRDEADKVAEFGQMLRDKDITVLDVNELGKSVFECHKNAKDDMKLATLFIWITNGTLTAEQSVVANEYLLIQAENQFVQIITLIADNSPVTDNYYKNNYSLKFCGRNCEEFLSFEQHTTHVCMGTMPLTYPIGPVYHGLVWTTALNYLKPVMPRKTEALADLEQAYRKENIGGKFYPKVILMIEKLCRDTEGMSFEQFDNIEEAKLLTITSQQQAPACTRNIATGIYKVTYNNEVFFVSFEFVRAILCLEDIKKSKQIPISYLQLEDQCKKFEDLFRAEAYGEGIKEHCALLYFDADEHKDDSNTIRLSEIIGKFVKRELEKLP